MTEVWNWLRCSLVSMADFGVDELTEALQVTCLMEERTAIADILNQSPGDQRLVGSLYRTRCR